VPYRGPLDPVRRIRLATDSLARKGHGGAWFDESGYPTVANPCRGRSIGEGQKIGDQNAYRASAGALKSPRFTNAAERPTPADGRKNGGDWFSSGEGMSLQRRAPSGSNARKAASARIAKIPFALANYLATVYDPRKGENREGHNSREWDALRAVGGQ